VAIDPVKLFLRFKWLLLIAAVVGGVIGVGSHFVLLKVYPIFTSEVYFECLPPELDPSVIRADKVDAEEIERFMGTQVDRMKSVQVLDRVVRDARLRGEAPDWTSDYLPRRQLRCRQRPGGSGEDRQGEHDPQHLPRPPRRRDQRPPGLRGHRPPHQGKLPSSSSAPPAPRTSPAARKSSSRRSSRPTERWKT
jgi:hypothetical protein